MSKKYGLPSGVCRLYYSDIALTSVGCGLRGAPTSFLVCNGEYHKKRH